VTIEDRFADNQYDRLPALASDLVGRRVSVIVAYGVGPALAARKATNTIPIVFAVGVDPVKSGLVTSFNKPNGNATGVAQLNIGLEAKQLQILHEAVPSAAVFAVLVNPTLAAVETQRSAEAQARELKAAALTLGVELHVLGASVERELDTAFAALTKLRAGAVVIGTDPLFTSRSQQLAALALRYAVPSVYQFRDFAVAGGLMSYGGSFTEAYRLAGTYAGRILKGERPAELAVQRYAKLELIINLKTAKALGLDVPQSVLARADEVIE
jgi:putative ABC transport system substrate-binding protein